MKSTEILRQLVRTPSVNPDDKNGGGEEAGEARLAELLGGILADLGAEVAFEEVLSGRPNLIARFAPRDGRPRVLFGPHLDTVGIDGMEIDPFAAEIRDGRLYGRGACDTKGPMAAMIGAMAEHARDLAGFSVAVDFVAFMGEESGQWGSKHFAREHAAEYRFAVVGEPTGLDVVHASKGSLWATVRATGKAAHSSQPEAGENAILKLARAIETIDCAMSAKLPAFADPVLGAPTCNVGVIRGGTRANIVPDLAEAELDIRTTPALAAEPGGASEFLRIVLGDASVPVELTNLHENPPMRTPPDHPDVRKLLAARPGTRLVGAPWFSDAAHLAAEGLPAVCLGPGSIDQAHTAREFIDLAALDEGTRQFSAYLSSLR